MTPLFLQWMANRIFATTIGIQLDLLVEEARKDRFERDGRSVGRSGDPFEAKHPDQLNPRVDQRPGIVKGLVRRPLADDMSAAFFLLVTNQTGSKAEGGAGVGCCAGRGKK